MASKMIQGKWVAPNNKNIKNFMMQQIPKQMRETANKAIEVALNDLGNQILKLADERVPEDTGDLRRTGKVTVEQVNDAWRMEVTYGGDGVDYAFYVEYNIPSPPEVKNYTKPGTGPLYLTRSGDEVLTPDNINKALRSAFRSV